MNYRDFAWRFQKELLLGAAVGIAACLLVGSAQAAQTVHLRLQIDGNDVEGESTIASMEREGTIEIASFSSGVFTPIDPASGMPAGRRQHRPVKIIKRIDKSTPLLIKALANNEPVTSAEFMFFRPSPGGSGAEEKYMTILLEDGLISSDSFLSEDAVMGGESAPPMMETVGFTFYKITWTYEIGGATHMDTWDGSQP